METFRKKKWKRGWNSGEKLVWVPVIWFCKILFPVTHLMPYYAETWPFWPSSRLTTLVALWQFLTFMSCKKGTTAIRFALNFHIFIGILTQWLQELSGLILSRAVSLLWTAKLVVGTHFDLSVSKYFHLWQVAEICHWLNQNEVQKCMFFSTQRHVLLLFCSFF